MNIKNKFKVTVLVIVMFAVWMVADSGVAQKVKLNPIKPAPKQMQPLTDEQQAILAVRNAKASVVNIIGLGSSFTGTSGGLEANTVSGTGFIIDPEGYIVSNNHVVQDASLKYTVVFADGTEYAASIVGLDKFNDVAVLKINANNLPVAKLGNSDALETGQSVFAIGNSLGKYQNTVTKGVVSGLGRNIGLGTILNPLPRLQKLVQTDASINPGNSGGPLINLSGEVVGMSTLIDTEGQSLGFAVPINTVKDSVKQLRTSGKISKPYVGVNFSTINKAFLAVKPLTVKQGAYIASVTPGGPAAAAGVQSGDVVTAINKQPLTESNELDQVIAKFSAGDQILLTIDRNGVQIDVTLVLTEFK